jgi:hypothetical protein
MSIPQNELHRMAVIGAQYLLQQYDSQTPPRKAEVAKLKPKRRISAKGRANIAAAMKKRWARWRKARMVA